MTIRADGAGCGRSGFPPGRQNARLQTGVPDKALAHGGIQPCRQAASLVDMVEHQAPHLIGVAPPRREQAAVRGDVRIPQADDRWASVSPSNGMVQTAGDSWLRRRPAGCATPRLARRTQ